MKPAVRSVLRWVGIVVASLVVIVILALTLMDWNWLKKPVERVASAKSGRTVTIGGNLDVHIWSWTPTVTVNALTVGNPPWESKRPMLQVERLQIQLKLLPLLKGDVILPRVELLRPQVYLHRERSGRANWTFQSTAPTNEKASKPTRLPVLRDLLIVSGTIDFADDIRKLKLQGTVEAHEKPSHEDPKPFRIQGHGSLNDQPFCVQVAGGPLVNLDPEHPYPFDLQIMAGQIHVVSSGIVQKPFDLGALDFEVTASGDDLAELFYLTQLALPNTPPFKLHVHIKREEMRFQVTDIAGTLGQSDLNGKLDIDASRKRPFVSGDLDSRNLALSDLAASLGSKPKTTGSLDGHGAADSGKASGRKGKPPTSEKAPPSDKAPPASPNDRLFPDAKLQVERVRAMDADVRFKAQSIQAGSVPFKEVILHIKLDQGVLSIDPFQFVLPQGRIAGATRIDARKPVPDAHIDVRVHDIQLDQLKGKAPGASPPLGGVMEARAVIDGKGDSVHRVMSDANGMVTVILPHGEVRSAFAELTGINVANGLGLLLKGDNDRAEIRCGVAQFGVHDGVMSAQTVVFDTQKVRITAHGDIRLGPEELDLSIKGEPKKIRLARLRSPVEVHGHLLKPAIGINAGDTLKQGAIAAALGTVFTPFAAVLAFVDPGLAKDEKCSALLSDTENKSGPAPPPKPGASSASQSAAGPSPKPTTDSHAKPDAAQAPETNTGAAAKPEAPSTPKPNTDPATKPGSRPPPKADKAPDVGGDRRLLPLIPISGPRRS
jgi:uncharacterized protein involved in outer membrane biogenesis